MHSCKRAGGYELRRSVDERISNGWEKKGVQETKGGFRGEDERASGVVSFNWASGSRTSSDNIKGQIYIKHCWEMSTHAGKGRRAEKRREEERGREATGSR